MVFFKLTKHFPLSSLKRSVIFYIEKVENSGEEGDKRKKGITILISDIDRVHVNDQIFGEFNAECINYFLKSIINKKSILYFDGGVIKIKRFSLTTLILSLIY